MKKVIIYGLLVIATFSGFTSTQNNNPLMGRWEWNHIYQGSQMVVLAVFRANGVYDGFINKKSFVSGTYKMKHDTLYISDPICNSKYEGTYKVRFFGDRDSMQCNVIKDTCRARREGSDGFVYKRLKTAQ